LQMSDSKDSSSQTELPSQQKLKEAKRKGQVAKSQELNALIVLAVVFCYFIFQGERVLANLAILCRDVLAEAGYFVFDTYSMAAWFEVRVEALIALVGPVIALIALANIAIQFTQVGPVFSMHPMKPSFQKINPISGLKKLFSKRTAYESVKNIIKIAAFSAVVFWTVTEVMIGLLKLSMIHPSSYIDIFGGFAKLLVARLLAVMFFIVLIDIVFSRKEYIGNLKMSKREVKEEHKRNEGDPLIKSKRREFQRGIKENQQSVAGVKDADVVITNPTHISVALSYNRETMIAPVIVGVGADHVAKDMRFEAKKHQVKMVESRLLAQVMYRKSRVGRAIPSECFLDVATIYRELLKERKVMG